MRKSLFVTMCVLVSVLAVLVFFGVNVNEFASASTNSANEKLAINTSTSSGIFTTKWDGGIIVAERDRKKLMIFKGGTSGIERNWNNAANLLWYLDLRAGTGVTSDLRTYKTLWTGKTSINDVKRVIHKGKIHLVVTGNGGNAVGMYEYATKKCIYWSKTTTKSPHDVEYIPKGNGLLAVANPGKANPKLEIYDISRNNKGCSFSMRHAGIHSVHWDAKQDCLWAWGSGQSGLKNYKVVFVDGKPQFKLIRSYRVTVPNFKVGMAHGGSPMIINHKRYLLLAGLSGILQFNTETHAWKVYKWANGIKKFKNPKGVSYNSKTGEVITLKNHNKVYSAKDGVGDRQINNAHIYKARWWFHEEFSYQK